MILYAILVTFSSKSKTDLDSYSLRPFEILVPEGSAPVTCRPHRINPILAKEVDATLNQYLVAGLIQCSTYPYPRLLVVILKKSGGVRITANYSKLNKISSLCQLPFLAWTRFWALWARDGCYSCSTWFLRSMKSPHSRTQFL